MDRLLPASHSSSGVGQPTIGRPFYGQAKGQLRLTWRPSAGSPQKRRISVRIVSERSAGKYQSAGSVLQVPGPCMNSYGFIFATYRDSSLRSE